MKDCILNVLLRGVWGVLGMYLCNILFNYFGVGIHMGINVLNLLLIGSLGIGGFGLVLSIACFSILWKTTKKHCGIFCESFRLVFGKTDMLKSIQDKRLSGVSIRKAYHDRVPVKLPILWFGKMYVWTFFLILWKFMCSILNNPYIFRDKRFFGAAQGMDLWSNGGNAWIQKY